MEVATQTAVIVKWDCVSNLVNELANENLATVCPGLKLMIGLRNYD